MPYVWLAVTGVLESLIKQTVACRMSERGSVRSGILRREQLLAKTHISTTHILAHFQLERDCIAFLVHQLSI